MYSIGEHSYLPFPMDNDHFLENRQRLNLEPKFIIPHECELSFFPDIVQLCDDCSLVMPKQYKQLLAFFFDSAYLQSNVSHLTFLFSPLKSNVGKVNSVIGLKDAFLLDDINVNCGT